MLLYIVSVSSFIEGIIFQQDCESAGVFRPAQVDRDTSYINTQGMLNLSVFSQLCEDK